MNREILQNMISLKQLKIGMQFRWGTLDRMRQTSIHQSGWILYRILDQICFNRAHIMSISEYMYNRINKYRYSLHKISDINKYSLHKISSRFLVSFCSSICTPFRNASHHVPGQARQRWPRLVYLYLGIHFKCGHSYRLANFNHNSIR